MRELTSAKTDDNETESGGCEVETPRSGCVLLPLPTLGGRAGTAAAMIFLTGKTRVEPISLEPGALRRSFGVPSPLLGLEPIAETIGARGVPGSKQS